MSNLSLPTMTYDALSERKAKTLAYMTTLEKRGEVVEVFHHHSLIAKLTPDSVYVSTAGWHSQTTQNRINTILRHNGIDGYWVCTRQYEQKLLMRIPSSRPGPGIFDWPGSLLFSRTPGEVWGKYIWTREN